MTTSLADYLRDEYQQDKQQLKGTLDVILAIAPIFVKCFDNAGPIHTWPYEVVGGTPGKIGNFSASTHSMILFVLDAILQGRDKSIPGPEVKPVLCPPRLRVPRLEIKDLSSVVRKAKVEMIKQLVTRKKPLVKSSTFGDDDPLTLSWLAELILRYRATADDVSQADLKRLKTRVRAVATKVCRRPTDRLFENVPHEQIPHCFQMLRAVHLAKAAAQFGGQRRPMLRLAETTVQTFLDHLHQQLGYYSIPDSRFDPATLVFAMEGALQLDPHSLSDSTIECVFRTLELSQKGNSYWRPITPFLSSSRGLVLFPVSVEISNSLLRSFELLHDAHRPTYSSQLEPMLRRYVQWLLARAERVPLGGAQVIAWHSEHVNRPGTVHLWETSQVLLFLVHYYSVLQRKIAWDGLMYAGLTVRDSIKKIPDYWKHEPLRVLSRLGGTRGSSGPTRSYAALRIIQDNFVSSRSSRSLVLYGPPGTGKTTLAAQLAASLQQPLLVITVSDFLAGAADEVEARAKGIFQVLDEQEDIVILFDEIDQFLLDRNGQRYQDQTGIFQFLTPGMLTKFQNLKDLDRSVFIVATNYEERIDGAIKRQGRFDYRLLLSLPDKERRKELLWTFLCGKLKWLRADDSLWIKFKKKATKADARKLVAAMKNEDLRRDMAAKNQFLGFADNVVRSTALFGRGDLEYLVDNELEVEPGDSWKSIAEKLNEVRSRVQPSVRIAEYERRFDSDEDPQSPFEEFVLLLYLLGESGQKVSPKDRKWIIEERKISVDALMASVPASDKAKTKIRKSAMAALNTAKLA